MPVRSICAEEQPKLHDHLVLEFSDSLSHAGALICAEEHRKLHCHLVLESSGLCSKTLAQLDTFRRLD